MADSGVDAATQMAGMDPNADTVQDQPSDETLGAWAGQDAINTVADLHNLIMQKGSEQMKKDYNDMMKKEMERMAQESAQKRGFKGSASGKATPIDQETNAGI